MRSFAIATGIQDQAIIECLVDSGIELSTLTAFIWVPIVFVAWADGHADELEKKSILKALTSKGMSPQTASMMIAHEWFQYCPTNELWKTWEDFVVTSLAGLKPTSRNQLVDEIVKLCYIVAHASGGFLGRGKASPTETEVIDRVIETLNRGVTPQELIS